MAGKKSATSLDFLGINTITNLATPVRDLDALRKIDLQAESTRLEALLNNTSTGVSLSQVRQEISSSIGGVFRLMGNANASEANALAATGMPADHAFNPGDTYRVVTTGQAFGVAATAGDMVAFTSGGWVLLEGSGDATIAQGDGLVVGFAGGIYSIALAPQVIQQLATLTTSVSQAQADATVARGLAENHAPRLDSLDSHALATDAAIGTLTQEAITLTTLTTQQAQAISQQAQALALVEAFTVVAEREFQRLDFLLDAGTITHFNGQPIALVIDAGYIPAPGMPGYQLALESGGSHGGSFLLVTHPKQSIPAYSLRSLIGNGECSDAIAEQGCYCNEATGQLSNQHWLELPSFGGKFSISFQ
jgi:hypothetical protein